MILGARLAFCGGVDLFQLYLIEAELFDLVLLFKGFFVLNAATGQTFEQAAIIHDRSFHCFQAHSEQEQSEELETRDDDDNHHSPLQLLSGYEMVILPGQVEKPEVDYSHLNYKR